MKLATAIATAFVTMAASTGLLAGAAAVPTCVVEPGADLSGCDFRDANLTDADLTDADLTDADLTDAILVRALLTNADLTNADLTNADLTDAYLGRANLTGATTTGATISEVGISNTRVGDFLFTAECADPSCELFTGDLRLVAYDGSLGPASTPDPDEVLTLPSEILTLPVAIIGGGAFSGAVPAEGSLRIPGSIKSIEGSAFANAKFNGEMTLGNGLRTIGDYAFLGTDFIGLLTIPNSVTRIGSSAFQGTDFTTLALGLGVQSIGANAFSNAPLGRVDPEEPPVDLVIPNSVTTIGESAFYGTGFTGELRLGSGLQTIGSNAFVEGPEFTGRLTIPRSLTNIGDGAFLATPIEGGLFSGSRFSALIFESRDSTTTIGNDAFKNIRSFRGNLIIPEGVNSIGTYAFAGTGFDGRLTIPDSMTSISDYAFSVSSFTSVTLGSNLTSIGVEAFGSVPLTGTLEIPSNVTSLGARAFALTEITSVAFPSGLTSIGDSAFASASSLRGELALPTGLETLGSAAFYGTSISGSLVIPSRITNIAASTFGITRVSQITLSSATTSIGAEAFYRTAIETLTLPRTLASIGDNAFGWRFKNDAETGAVIDITGGTFTFQGNAPSIASSAFQKDGGYPAEDLVIRYPEGASGWPMDPNPFGLRSRQVAVAGPPAPRPEPSSPTLEPSPANTPQPSGAGAQKPVAGEDPLQTPGTAGFQVNGQETPVRTESGPRGSGLTLQAGPVEFTLRSQTANGRRVPLAPDGSLILAQTGEVPISGDGLEPNSSVAVTLFSNPISLGSTPVGADGTFKTAPVIPATVPLGAHTLQLSGRTKNGDPFVLSVGVLVETPAAALGADPVVSVRPAALKPGASVAVTARSVQAGCRVTFTIAGKRAVERASKRGIAQAQITLPKRLPRPVVLRATVGGPRCSAVTVSKELTSGLSTTSKAASR